MASSSGASYRPRGWYRAQNLTPPAGTSMGDANPCELPDGRLVCGAHGLVRCDICCRDYNFMDDLSDSEDDEDKGEVNIQNSLVPVLDPADLFGSPMRRGTGRLFPTEFPASRALVPTDVFRPFVTYNKATRWLHFTNPRKFLIFTDGACLNNGGPNPTAGWAFVHGPGSRLTTGGKPLFTSGRLEHKGPFGEDSIQSSNRAELRAVIAALRFRHWVGEGFTSVVIATDSEYVMKGATEWAKKWIANGWKTSGKVDVKNRDLWELLLGEVEGWKEKGLEVVLWRVPRGCNRVADGKAKEAAGGEEVIEWVDPLGVNIRRVGGGGGTYD